jgi:urease accessory protein
MRRARLVRIIMLMTITTAMATVTSIAMAEFNAALAFHGDLPATDGGSLRTAEPLAEMPLPTCEAGPGRAVPRDISSASSESLSSPARIRSARPSSTSFPTTGEKESLARDADSIPAEAAGYLDTLSAPALQRLLAWLSPSFPVGAFSYSHGLEWAVEDGSVTDATTLSAWLGAILRHGAGWTDAVLFAHAYRAVGNDDPAMLRELVELAAALQPSKERHLEATAQGQAFLTTIGAAWSNPILTRLVAEIPADPPVTYAVAVALTAAAHGVPLGAALTAYLAAFVANLVSAGVRAIPIGQTDGQRIIAATAPLIEATAGAALAAGLDQLGGAAFRADIASMKHETQYTRLFRS